MQGHLLGGIFQSPASDVSPKKNSLWHEHISDADEPCTTRLGKCFGIKDTDIHATDLERECWTCIYKREALLGHQVSRQANSHEGLCGEDIRIYTVDMGTLRKKKCF